MDSSDQLANYPKSFLPYLTATKPRGEGGGEYIMHFLIRTSKYGELGLDGFATIKLPEPGVMPMILLCDEDKELPEPLKSISDERKQFDRDVQYMNIQSRFNGPMICVTLKSHDPVTRDDIEPLIKKLTPKELRALEHYSMNLG